MQLLWQHLAWNNPCLICAPQPCRHFWYFVTMHLHHDLLILSKEWNKVYFPESNKHVETSSRPLISSHNDSSSIGLEGGKLELAKTSTRASCYITTYALVGGEGSRKKHTGAADASRVVSLRVFRNQHYHPCMCSCSRSPCGHHQLPPCMSFLLPLSQWKQHTD